MKRSGGMGRPKFVESLVNPYHLATRCNNRDWFNLPMPHVWDIMQRYLHFVQHAFRARIHAFVLMSNHYHLMASFPNGGVADCMQYFNRETSRTIAADSGRINHVWGGRYFRSEIRGYHHYMNVYKYLYRNPVEVGLSATVEAYPYSTLRGLLGASHLLIPTEEDTLLFGDLQGTLAWMNRQTRPEDREAIRKALRRAEYSFPQDKHSGEEHPLCTRLY